MRDFLNEFKVERKVFEKRTLLAIYRLMNKKILKSVESIVKEGKESIVCVGRNYENEILAIKIYRILYCDFKNMWKYLIGDPRFKRIKKERYDVVINWARREFKNLKKAFSNDVNCPKPFAVYKNILVMKFIGKDFVPAPRLVDIKVRNPKEIYKQIISEMEKLADIKLIHSDLSPYNILVQNEKIYLIDFSQAITSSHPLALDFLERDCKNVNKYFERLGIKINEKIFDDLKKRYEI